MKIIKLVKNAAKYYYLLNYPSIPILVLIMHHYLPPSPWGFQVNLDVVGLGLSYIVPHELANSGFSSYI